MDRRERDRSGTAVPAQVHDIFIVLYFEESVCGITMYNSRSKI